MEVIKGGLSTKTYSPETQAGPKWTFLSWLDLQRFCAIFKGWSANCLRSAARLIRRTRFASGESLLSKPGSIAVVVGDAAPAGAKRRRD